MGTFSPKVLLRLVLLTVLTGVLMATVACEATENSVGDLIDRPAPDFNLKDLNGNSVRLSGLLGKTVFFNFWTTSCPPCVAEMPIFQELFNEWNSRNDVVFLSINLGEDANKVSLFAERRKISFPIFLDANWEAGRVYQIHYTPTSCLVDEKGLLRLFAVGSFEDKAALDKKLARFISAKR
jgi:thiol-disulfide isomerase/thioredoxin